MGGGQRQDFQTGGIGGIPVRLVFVTVMLFYNVWKYDVERIVREEGSFHGKISGKFGDKELEWIQNFGGVSKTRVGEGTGETTLVELWFYPPGRVYEDLPKLAERLEIGQEKVTFHSSLLSRYLVPDPENPSSVREMAILLLVPLLACISLILIIHHAFAVSMSGKVRQLGNRSHPVPNPWMALAGGWSGVPEAGCGGIWLGNGGLLGNHERTGCLSAGIISGASAAEFWVSSPGICLFYGADFGHYRHLRLAAGQKTQPDDAS